MSHDCKFLYKCQLSSEVAKLAYLQNFEPKHIVIHNFQKVPSSDRDNKKRYDIMKILHMSKK